MLPLNHTKNQIILTPVYRVFRLFTSEFHELGVQRNRLPWVVFYKGKCDNEGFIEKFCILDLELG